MPYRCVGRRPQRSRLVRTVHLPVPVIRMLLHMLDSRTDGCVMVTQAKRALRVALGE